MAKKSKADPSLIVPAEVDPSHKRPRTTRPLVEKEGKLVPGDPVSTDPEDLADYKGKYKHPAYSEPFGLKVVDDPHGRTHHLKNRDFFWAGTEEEFKSQFDRL